MSEREKMELLSARQQWHMPPPDWHSVFWPLQPEAPPAKPLTLWQRIKSWFHSRIAMPDERKRDDE